jgi:pimeloyl-ACP methyl ester carboxylesterase
VLLLLTAAGCVPTLDAEPDAIAPGARLRTAPFEPPPGVAAGLDRPDAPLASGYEVLGRGDPVVMVHGVGGGSSRFQYRANAPVVARAGDRVYLPDLLGFGASSRPAGRSTQDLLVAQLDAFLADVVGEPAVLVANGLSAAYAIRRAVERPEAVRALVLLAPTGYERLARPQTEARIAAFDVLRGPLGEVLYFALADEDTQRFFLLDAFAGEASLTPAVRARYDRELRQPGARWIVFSFVTGTLDQDVSGLWPRVEQPALVVWGLDAETTPVEDAEAFLRARPATAFLPLDGAKLLPNEDRPAAFDQALLDFLARLP